MSMGQASRAYGVPYSTLNDKINFRQPMEWNTKIILMGAYAEVARRGGTGSFEFTWR